MNKPDIITIDCRTHGITAFDSSKCVSMVFHAPANAKEVLRITPEGELIFTNPTEAAQALLVEWNRLTGRA